MTRLNQVLAIEGSAQTRAHRTISEVHHQLERESLLDGIAREYQPANEDGEKLPPESRRVQLRTVDAIERVRRDLVKFFDVKATKEAGNREASADVVVDGEVLLADVPVSYLLFLEKQLVDLYTFVVKLPTLDPTREWEFSEAQGVFVTPPTETLKTKKVPRNHVKAEATDKHPAQVEVYHEDVTVGRWTTRFFSGALPVPRVEALLGRVISLQEAVKKAREEANSAEVTDVFFGKSVFDYLFA